MYPHFTQVDIGPDGIRVHFEMPPFGAEDSVLIPRDSGYVCRDEIEAEVMRVFMEHRLVEVDGGVAWRSEEGCCGLPR